MNASIPPGHLFPDTGLGVLATPLPVRIRKAAKKNHIGEAITLCRQMAESRVTLHDFFADSCTVLWGWVADHLGEEVLAPMFRYVFAQSAERQLYAIAGADAPAHLMVRMLAKSAWRSHSCFGRGEFPGGFSISEDEEKFVFRLSPCGSGARLMLRGLYEKGQGGVLTAGAYPWTYNRKGFPGYCVHCAFLNELLPFESAYGNLLWPVEPWTEPGGACIWNIYKDPNRIPDRYFARLGITRPAPHPSRRTDSRRYFTDHELAEMARPATDRIIERLEQGDRRGALRLCRDVMDEFLFLHDLYVMMLVTTLTFIADRSGEDGLGRALSLQYNTCVKDRFTEKLKEMDARESVRFLADHVIGTDACNGTGRYPAVFSIHETDDEIKIRLDPCGSGGRLLRAGSYGKMPSWTRIRERLENRIVLGLARHIHLPDRSLTWAMPHVVGYFSQRKPFSQGRTRAAHSWSFHRMGLPYYCCICGMAADQCRDGSITIIPPASDKSACVWKIRK
jgi:hypothetical protein